MEINDVEKDIKRIGKLLRTSPLARNCDVYVEGELEAGARVEVYRKEFRETYNPPLLKIFADRVSPDKTEIGVRTFESFHDDQVGKEVVSVNASEPFDEIFEKVGSAVKNYCKL